MLQAVLGEEGATDFGGRSLPSHKIKFTSTGEFEGFISYHTFISSNSLPSHKIKFTSTGEFEGLFPIILSFHLVNIVNKYLVNCSSVISIILMLLFISGMISGLLHKINQIVYYICNRFNRHHVCGIISMLVHCAIFFQRAHQVSLASYSWIHRSG